MQYSSKTKQELIEENALLTQRIQKLEFSDSERTLAEEALRESEKRFRHVTENLQEAVWYADLSGKFDFLSPTMANIYGRPLLEMTGNPAFWIEASHPEDQAMVHASKEALLRDYRVALEYRIILPDGTVRWIADRKLLLLNEHGEPSRIAGILSDITERKQREETLRESERRFRELAELLPETVYETDIQGILTFVNRNAFDRFGYTKEDFTGGLNALDMVTPDDRGRALENMQRIMNGETIGSNEFTLQRKDGRTFPSMIHSTAIIHDGKHVGLRGFIVDIAERKRAEEALRESEEKHRLIIENSHDIIYTITSEGVFTFVSPSWTALLGHPTTQVVGKPFQQFVHPDDIAGCLAFLQKSIETGQRQTGVEYRVRHADGSWRWHTTNSVPLRDKAGKIVGFEGSASDFTDRKRVEEITQRSEEKFSKAFHSSPILTAISTIEDGRFLDVNGIFLQTLLFSREEVIGKTSLELGFFANPVQRQAVRKITEEKGYARNIETQIAAKNGQIIDGLFSAEPITVNNEKCWLTVMVDVTEQKRAEEALRRSETNYRSVIENIQDVFYRSDDQGNLIMASPSYATLLGYESLDDCLGKSIAEVGYYDPEKRTELLRELQGKGSVTNYEVVLKRRDGTPVTVETNSHFYLDDSGNIAGVEGTFRDITERKQAEDEKRRLEERLQHADKMDAIGTLAGGIAHDFNNLLMGIQGYASLSLMNLDPSHPNYERLKRIEDQVQSGADLTRQLLGFARGGRYDVKPADMNDILEKSSSMFGRTKKEISIHRKYGKDLWAAEVDQGQMEQVFMNLYVNAWQAMPGGGEIYLETENIILDDEQAFPYAVNPGRYIKISMTDTGTGMDEKTRERIFDPFFTTKEMGRGTGLGLATVYGIIKCHKGMINVYSEPGHGTTFTIYLPASEKEVVKEKTETATIARGTETILIVDDEKMVLEVSKTMLESLGYRVFAAGSGQEAIAVYLEKQKEIDLVILDMIMPGISGGETFDRLREINPGIKALLSSGYSINGQAQEILDRGCNGFLQKPFQLSKFSSKVRETID